MKFNPQPKPEPKPKKKLAPIRQISKKREQQNREYLRLNKKYLEGHPECEVINCKNRSNQVHHRKGRIGRLLCATEHFLAVCSPCHAEIELHVNWAKENGYSIDRL
jgi:hypothetical protein